MGSLPPSKPPTGPAPPRRPVCAPKGPWSSDRRPHPRRRRLCFSAHSSPTARNTDRWCRFIHPAADDNAKIVKFNYEATKLAIERAMKNEPPIAEITANKDKVEHPFAK